jgi:hypothetical protein
LSPCHIQKHLEGWAIGEIALRTWVVGERKKIVIFVERHAVGKIIGRPLTAYSGALRPDMAVIALLAHAGRTVLVTPRRTLLADSARPLALSRHAPPALSFRLP